MGNDGTWIDNNEYYPEEGNLDEVIVTAPYTINNSLSQDRTYLQHNPIADLNVTMPVDFTNTDQNMFHRRDVERGDSSVRDALSSDVVDHIYDYMMPSTWAGAADKLFDHDENGNLKYNFFRDFNKVFNPTYDNQGWVGLVGADEWADEHPEATAAINTGIDFALPIYVNKAVTWLPEARSAWKTFRQEVRPSEVPNFKRNLAIDLLNPNRGVVKAINQNRYALNENLMNQ